MVRLIISLHRHPACPEPSFRAIWADEHGPAARELPGVHRYVEHGPGPDPCHEDQSCDGVIELWFAGAPELQSALMSLAGQGFLRAIAEQLDPRRFAMAVEPAPASSEVL